MIRVSSSSREDTALTRILAALVPPYNILVDTNFFSHTIGAKLPILETA